MVWLSVLFVLGISLLLLFRWPSTRRKSTLPPGPSAIPVLGHLHLLVTGHPHQVLMQLSSRYGALLSMRFGSLPVVVASSKESATEFLKTFDLCFASRPPTTAKRLFFKDLPDLVFAPYGEEWRTLRRISTVKLLAAKRLDLFQKLREDEVWALVKDILSLGSRSTVDLRQRLSELTFNIFTRMVMGKRYFGQHTEGDEFLHLMEEMVELFAAFPPGEYLPFLRWLDIGRLESRFKSASNRLHALLARNILEHELKKQEDTGSPLDFVDFLLEERSNGEGVLQQKETIANVLINLMAGGTETSSATLEWAMAELIKHPSVMSKLQDEVTSVVGTSRLVKESDIIEMSYLHAVVKETFRLHPVIPLLPPHYAMESCRVMGYDIPAGTTVYVNVYAIGRDPSTWQEPLNFRPERFLESHIDVKGQDFELIPFGSGRRMCPAVRMALLTVHTTLANLVHAFDWPMPPGQQVNTESEKAGSVTLLPAKRLEPFASPRLPLEVYRL